jgi:hypothetical protein
MANDIFPGATLRQLKEWGFPQGVLRPTPPVAKAFSVIHITGNPGDPIATAEGEAAWRINDPANQNSATFFVNRDGSVVQTLGDPLHMDPWANGIARNPDRTNARIAAALNDGVNLNERTIVAIENVGRPNDLPITPAQEKADAAIIAHYHAAAGVPIRRSTVVGHYQIDSVERPNCPAINKAVIDRIVALAQGLTAAPVDPLEECQRLLNRVRRQRDELVTKVSELEDALDDATADKTRLRARIQAIKELAAAIGES